MEEQGKPGDCVEREEDIESTVNFLPEKDLQPPQSQYIHNHNYQNQSQTINNDMTAINAVLRGADIEKQSFFEKVGIELLLNIVNPERFYKMAQGVLLLALAWMIKDFTPAEIVKLIQALAGASSK
jgi:hypothetical protein